MSFFQQLDALQLEGDLKIVVSKSTGKTVVSVLLNNEKCGDKAAKSIAPMILSGTADELDAGFFDAISAPMKEVSGLMVSMEAHLASVATAKQQAAMNAKSNKPATTPAAPVDPLRTAYVKAMTEVEKLIESKKYTDAIKKLPDPKTHANMKDIIEKRRAWLMSMAMGGMFPEPYPVDPDEVAAEPVEEAPISKANEESEQDESETDND